MKKLTAALLLISPFLTATTAHAAAWETTRRWDQTAENAFARFISQIPADYFSRDDHPFGRISTDCADAAYTLRIIFAAKNGLPVAFKGGAVTNETSQFDHVPAGTERIRKFISAVNDVTSTETLSKDTYPLAVRPGVIRPGAMFLHVQGDDSVPLTYRAGHVYYLQQVKDNGLIRYFSSTVPAAIRPLAFRNGLNFAPMEKSGGYRAWIWPDSNERPNFSEEQFELADWRPASYKDATFWYKWQRAFTGQIALTPATPKDRLYAQLANVQMGVSERIATIRQGWRKYRDDYGGRGCFNKKDYSDYSTPTRDHKLQVELQNFRVVARAYVRSHNKPFDDEAYMREFYRQFKFDIGGLEIDMNDLRQAFLTRTALAISEPEHSPEVRWGLKALDDSQWPCPDRIKPYLNEANP